MEISTAQGYLDTWIAASVGLAANATYTVSFPNGLTRSVTRQDEQTVRNQITYWKRQVDVLTAKAAGSGSPGVLHPTWT